MSEHRLNIIIGLLIVVGSLLIVQVVLFDSVRAAEKSPQPSLTVTSLVNPCASPTLALSVTPINTSGVSLNTVSEQITATPSPTPSQTPTCMPSPITPTPTGVTTIDPCAGPTVTPSVIPTNISAASRNIAHEQITPTLSPTPSPTPTCTPAPITPTPTPTPSRTPTVVSGAYSDLVIDWVQITLEYTNCYIEGSGLGVRIGYRNIGRADAASFVIGINGNTQTVPPLVAGAQSTLWMNSYVNGTNTVTLDVNNEIVESDETNNHYSAPVPVPTLPFPCVTITPEATTTKLFLPMLNR